MLISGRPEFKIKTGKAPEWFLKIDHDCLVLGGSLLRILHRLQ
jgi:hypothetical protein